MGGFGGGYLEHSRQWLGTQWAGLVLGVSRASQSRQARPGEAQEPSWGTAKGGTLTMLACLGRCQLRVRADLDQVCRRAGEGLRPLRELDRVAGERVEAQPVREHARAVHLMRRDTHRVAVLLLHPPRDRHERQQVAQRAHEQHDHVERRHGQRRRDRWRRC